MNDKPDTNQQHIERNRPFLVCFRSARVPCTIAAPTLYAAAWIAQQEFGDDNIFLVERMPEGEAEPEKGEGQEEEQE